MPKPYTIRLFVPEGDPNAFKIIDKMNWTGIGLEVSREAWTKHRNRKEFNQAGIYILFGYQEGDDLPTLYIGQGDGILLKFPNGKTALIDAGNATFSFDNGERVIAPLLQRLSIKQIDYGFITHVDSDHYKGFLSLIKNGWIKEIYKPRLDTSLQKDVRLEKIILESKTPMHYYSKSKIDFGNLRLYILNDTTNSDYNNLDMNNRSGIFKVVHGNNSFLFTGDAEYATERILIKNYGIFLDSDLLKIGHHGSKSSSSLKFIDYVSPKIGLISAGLNNKFGHPAKLILDRYNKRGVLLYRTDIEGAVILQSDGESIKKIDWRNF